MSNDELRTTRLCKSTYLYIYSRTKNKKRNVLSCRISYLLTHSVQLRSIQEVVLYLFSVYTFRRRYLPTYLS